MIQNLIFINKEQEESIKTASLKFSLFKCLVIILCISGAYKVLSWIRNFFQFIQHNYGKIIKKFSSTKNLNRNNSNNNETELSYKPTNITRKRCRCCQFKD